MKVNKRVYKSCPPDFPLYADTEKILCEIIAVSHCHSKHNRWLVASPDNSSVKRKEQCDKEREPGFFPVLRFLFRLSCFTQSFLILSHF
jgi:hypothetical protein